MSSVSSTPMVLLPGTALSASMYNMLDLSNPSHCIDIDQLLSFEETIKTIEDQIPNDSLIIGYSLGARLAANISLISNKVKGLVLISFNAGIENIEEKVSRKEQDYIMAQLAREDLAKMYKRFDTNPVFDSELNIDNLRLKDSKVVAWQLEELGLGASPYLKERLMELRIPVMYLTGIRDTKYVELNKQYKKKTAFAFHFSLDSDHRVPISAPYSLSRHIEWFTDNVVNV